MESPRERTTILSDNKEVEQQSAAIVFIYFHASASNMIVVHCSGRTMLVRSPVCHYIYVYYVK